MFQLFLKVNGSNGTTIIRESNKYLNLKKGQESELFEKDQIVLLFSETYEP